MTFTATYRNPDNAPTVLCDELEAIDLLANSDAEAPEDDGPPDSMPRIGFAPDGTIWYVDGLTAIQYESSES